MKKLSTDDPRHDNFVELFQDMSSDKIQDSYFESNYYKKTK